MPIYEHKCPACENTQEVPCQIAELGTLRPDCEKCGASMKRIISSSNVIGDIEPYLDENIGSEPVYIESRQHRKQVMKQNNLVELG